MNGRQTRRLGAGRFQRLAADQVDGKRGVGRAPGIRQFGGRCICQATRSGGALLRERRRGGGQSAVCGLRGAFERGDILRRGQLLKLRSIACQCACSSSGRTRSLRARLNKRRQPGLDFLQAIGVEVQLSGVMS